MKIDAETVVPAAMLAEFLGLSRKRIEQLADEGVVPRLGRARYPLKAGVAGYIGWLKDDQRNAAKSASTSRMHEVRAEEISLRVSERKRLHLIEAQAEAVAVIDEFAGQLRSDIMAIPARLTRDVAMRRQFEDQIDEAFGAAGDRATAAASLTSRPKTPALNRGARRKAAAHGKKR